MYPGQQQQQPQFERSIDYLNQIAPKQQTRGLPTKYILIGIVVAVVLSVLLFVSIAAHSKPSVQSQLMTLYARLQTLQTVVNTEEPLLQDTSLQSTNSSLSLLLANSIRDVGSQLGSTANQTVRVPQSLATSERAYLGKLTDEFTNAKLNVQLDSTYAREMTYQLNIVHTMMKSIYNQTSSKSIQGLMSTTNDNLAPMQDTFSGFTGD